nr:uncharacterized protein LOC121122937 [Lepeophtheirus salmonis]
MSFAWPILRETVKKWTQECLSSQKNKAVTHQRLSGPTLFSSDPPRFCTLHKDVVGTLPPSNGYMYLLTVLDQAIRCTEVIHMCNTRAEIIVVSFFSGWVSRFGVLVSLHSGRVAQFTGGLWKRMGEVLGRNSLFPTAYHPESNGVLERFHRTLNVALAARMYQEDESWCNALPFVLIGIRASIPSLPGASFSPMHHLLGSAPLLPMSLADSSDAPKDRDLFNKVRNMKHIPHIIISQPSRRVQTSLDALKKASHVYIKNRAIKPSLSPT